MLLTPVFQIFVSLFPCFPVCFPVSLFPGKQGNRETAFLILQGKQGNRETALAANRETRETVSLFPSCCFFPKTPQKWF
jgi:hypothetical protein